MKLFRSLFKTIVLLSLLFSFNTQEAAARKLYKKLAEYCDILSSEFNKIPGDRKESLRMLGDYILNDYDARTEISLLFICDNNSRRSQFAQVWAQTASYYYKLKNINTYSGGISETSINYHIMSSLKSAGFSVTAAEAYSKNPVYLVSMGRKYPDILIFSKKYDYWNNPDAGFASVFCSDTRVFEDLVIAGSSEVIRLPYEDVKIFDTSSYGSSEKNDQLSREIARDMFFVMDYVSREQNKR